MGHDGESKAPKSAPPPAPPQAPKSMPGLKLRKQPEGTILAKCPSKKAGLKTASVIYPHGLRIFVVGKAWHLVDDDGTLRFTIGK